MKILSIAGKSYQMGDKTATTVMDTAKFAMKGKFAIYCLLRGNVIEMRNDVYETIKILKSQIRKYIKQGYTVKYVLGETDGKS